MNLDERINQAMDDAHEVWDHDASDFAPRAQNSQRVAAFGVLMAMAVATLGIIWSTNQSEPPAVATFPPTTAPASTLPTTAPASIPPTSTIPGDEPITIIHGALLDGTTYTVEGVDLGDGKPRGVDGVVVYDDGETALPIGVTRWTGGGFRGSSYSNGLLVVDTGDWEMVVDVYDDILATLGDEAGRILERSITGDQIDKHPVLRFSGPFRLATDFELPRDTEVAYQDFVVRRGCSGVPGSKCDLHRSVEVIHTDIEADEAPGEETAAFLSNTWIESTAPRFPSDPFYLDPGPLSPRIRHDLFWHEGQLVVWGGVWGEALSYWSDYPLFDGGVLDWSTGVWSTIPPPPFNLPEGQEREIQDRDPEHADSVVIGDLLIVEFGNEIAAWDLSGSGGWDLWEAAPFPVWDLTVGPGDSVVTIGPRMAIRQPEGAWEELSVPDGYTGSSDAVFVDGDQIYLALHSGSASCLDAGVPVLRFANRTWERVGFIDISTDEYTDCAIPDTMMVHDGTLYAWQERELRTVAMDLSDGRVRDIDRIPLAGCEGAFPPLVAGDRIVAGNSCNDTFAVLDTTTGAWHQQPLVGPMTEVVWTGEELVGWSVPWQSETPDAWHLPLDNP